MWIATVCLIGLAGCSSERHASRELGERERDSLIARSPLPGASVVGRAMALSDRAGRQAARQDSMFSSP
jgi:hypothetical protein